MSHTTSSRAVLKRKNTKNARFYADHIIRCLTAGPGEITSLAACDVNYRSSLSQRVFDMSLSERNS